MECGGDQCKRGPECSGEGREEERTGAVGGVRKVFLRWVVAELRPEGCMSLMEENGDKEG